MPYIFEPLRKRYDYPLKLLSQLMTPDPGHLNYIISKITHSYIQRKGLKYRILNQTIGVLECVKQELYRQVAVPFEDIKKAENGSISELDKE